MLLGLSEAWDRFMAALCIYREARNEPREGKVGVWWVLRNRRASGRWGDTFGTVITAPRQFSSFNLDDKQVSTFPPSTDPRWLECVDVVFNGTEADPTDGAQFYFNPKVASPVWARSMVKTASIGAHDFYKEV